jgi:hypothetical protein
MAYSDYYDVPISMVEYKDLDATYPQDLEVVVTYLDGTTATYRFEDEIREVTRQLQAQQQAILAGETLRVIPSQVPHSFDGVVWAQEFMRIIVNRGKVIDEDLMVAWFANALERGFDEGKKKVAADDIFGSRWGYPHVLG